MKDDHGQEIPTGQTYTRMADIEAANAAAGFHFFEPDSMRFFDSRIESGPYFGAFFVTSEQFHGSDGTDGARGFTVRYLRADGTVGSVGWFGGLHDLDPDRGHGSLAEAEASIWRIAEVLLLEEQAAR